MSALLACLALGGAAAYAQPYVASAATAALNSATSLTSDGSFSIYHLPVTFTATVTGSSSTPTGIVTFQEMTVPTPTELGTATLDGSAVARLTLSDLTVGTHYITARYGGSDVYNPSTSAVFAQIVDPSQTTTTVWADISPSVVGQPVTFTAEVTAVTIGAGIPTGGAVTFTAGTTPLGAAPVDGTGHANLTNASLSAGTHLVHATYTGTEGYNTSSTVDPWVQVVVRAHTTTTLTSDVNPSMVGDPVTFTAVVTATPPRGGTPNGEVAFVEGSTVLSTELLDGTATATFTTSALSVGVHTITAQYLGSPDYWDSVSAPYDQTVIGSTTPTTTRLCVSPNPAYLNGSVRFTATVTAVPPAGGPVTGTVTFTIDGVAQPPVAVDRGRAVLVRSDLGAGAHTVTATYIGDSVYAPSTSSETSTWVVYRFSGFHGAIANPPYVNKLSWPHTVRFQWQLTDYRGRDVSDPASFVSLTMTPASYPSWHPAGSAAVIGGHVTRDGCGTWSYAWDTHGVPHGYWLLTVTLADGTSHTVRFQIR